MNFLSAPVKDGTTGTVIVLTTPDAQRTMLAYQVSNLFTILWSLLKFYLSKSFVIHELVRGLATVFMNHLGKVFVLGLYFQSKIS